MGRQAGREGGRGRGHAAEWDWSRGRGRRWGCGWLLRPKPGPARRGGPGRTSRTWGCGRIGQWGHLVSRGGGCPGGAAPLGHGPWEGTRRVGRRCSSGATGRAQGLGGPGPRGGPGPGASGVRRGRGPGAGSAAASLAPGSHRGGAWPGARVWFESSATGPGLPGALAAGSGKHWKVGRASRAHKEPSVASRGVRARRVLRSGCAGTGGGGSARLVGAPARAPEGLGSRLHGWPVAHVPGWNPAPSLFPCRWPRLPCVRLVSSPVRWAPAGGPTGVRGCHRGCGDLLLHSRADSRGCVPAECFLAV